MRMGVRAIVERMRKTHRSALAALMMLPGFGAPAIANELVFTSEPMDEAFFGFAGRMMARVYNPFGGWEDNFYVGGGYQRLWGDPNGFRYGGEVGLTARIGVESSLEGWAGVIGRYDWVFGDLRAGASLTFGVSGVSNTLVGRERDSEAFHQGDATLLFYLSPEVNVSLAAHPETELFLRLQHRSGAWETLGNMAAGADAGVVGIRWHF
jgi:hypothetical protein